MPPYFPEQTSKEELKERFEATPKVGMVFRSFSKVAKKEKFYVVAGISENSILVGHVLINSKAYLNYALSQEIENLQINFHRF